MSLLMQLGEDSSEDTVVSYFRDAARFRAARAKEICRKQSAPFDVDSRVARLGIIRFEEFIFLLHGQNSTRLNSTRLRYPQPGSDVRVENLAAKTNHETGCSTQEILYFRKLFAKHEASSGGKIIQHMSSLIFITCFY
jgi:hypothetical protein